jgi:hypothetical protein
VIVLEGDDEEPEEDIKAGEPGTLTAVVTGPDGAVLFFAENSHQIQQRPDATLPPRMQIVLNLSVSAQMPGKHQISVTWKSVRELQWQRNFRVRAIPSQQTEDQTPAD